MLSVDPCSNYMDNKAKGIDFIGNSVVYFCLTAKGIFNASKKQAKLGTNAAIGTLEPGD